MRARLEAVGDDLTLHIPRSLAAEAQLEPERFQSAPKQAGKQ